MVQHGCIPVGCVPPATVAGWGWSLFGESVSGGRGLCSEGQGSLSMASLTEGLCLGVSVLDGWGPLVGGALSGRGLCDRDLDRMTHASENITLPQTSFAGGKNTAVRKISRTALNAPRLAYCNCFYYS